jgi:ABC-type cobalamin/Fe3+-siderophores transport system ATPase subunit
MIDVTCRDIDVLANGNALLRAVSLDFRPGKLTGLIGPNGAGKSTLLRVLAGYRRPSSGSIAWSGRDLHMWSATERGAISGYLAQQVEPVWSYSVREIVALGVGRAAGRAAPLDQVLGQHELQALSDRRWHQLSGGERSRTMLAAILATRPSIILADEPGASLDIRHRLDLVMRLKALARDAVVVVVMHDLDLAARFCDRIVLMDKGQVVADGPASEVIGLSDFERVFSVRFQREPLAHDRDCLIGTN